MKTPQQKLDSVLAYLTSVQHDRHIDFGKITQDYKVKVNPHVTDEEMQRMLYQLEKDGHIWNRGASYSITFTGLLFEGYEAKSSSDAVDADLQRLERDRLKLVDVANDRNQKRLNRLTLWLAVGTIALALIEIVKFLCELDPCVKGLFERIL